MSVTRTFCLRFANYILYLSTCLMIGAGLVLNYRLARGGRSKGEHLLSLDRHEWAQLHFAFALTFIILALTHLILNWSWVRKVATHGKPWLVLISVGLGLIFIALPLLAPIEIIQEQARGPQLRLHQNLK